MEARSPALLAVALLPLLLAGCTAPEGLEDARWEPPPSEPAPSPSPTDPGFDPETAYADAPARRGNTIAGQGEDRLSFTVPVGSPRLEIRASYVILGQGSVVLTGPANLPVLGHRDTVQGSKTFADDVWYFEDRPIPGPRELRVQVQGAAAYAFGIYY